MLRTSQTFNKIADALRNARKVMDAPTLNKKNPHFNSSYSDLGEIYRVSKEPLFNNNLLLLQSASVTQEGAAFVLTKLIHTISGEFFEDDITIMPVNKGPQPLGSAITYGKRYQAATILGLSAEDDDDGNEAEGKKQTAPPRQTVPDVRKDIAPVKVANGNQPASSHSDIISEPQHRRLMAIMGKSGWTAEDLKSCLVTGWANTSTKTILRRDYENICNMMENTRPSDALAKLKDSNENLIPLPSDSDAPMGIDDISF